MIILEVIIMDRQTALAQLKDVQEFYEKIEKHILEWHADNTVILKGAKIETASFRFYNNGKYIAYCNVHEGCFDVMMRYTAADILKISEIVGGMSDYAKEVWEDRYPCSTGAWIHYYVSDEDTNNEAVKLIDIKLESLIKKK